MPVGKRSLEELRNGGSGSGGGSGRAYTGTSTAVIPETPGTWFQDAQGWKLVKSDGSAYSSTWAYKNGYWYFIGTDSYMLQDRETWYYLNQDGKMAVSTTTPDGYQVDENGAWIK